MNVKKCTKCATPKPLEKYYKYTGAKDGHRNVCIECHIKNQNAIKEASRLVDCHRGNKITKIKWSNCYPGCNDACKLCPNPNEANRLSEGLTGREIYNEKYLQSVPVTEFAY